MSKEFDEVDVKIVAETYNIIRVIGNPYDPMYHMQQNLWNECVICKERESYLGESEHMHTNPVTPVVCNKCETKQLNVDVKKE